MSRQGNIISTVLLFTKENNIQKDEALKFLFNVLVDAGQIESDDNGEMLPDDSEWLNKVANKYYEISA